MLRKTIFLLLAGLALLGTGCDRDIKSDRTDLAEASPGDSLMYYMGQFHAHKFFDLTVGDTTLRSPENRKRYLEGIKAGLKAVKGEENAYNIGVRMGVRMADITSKLEEDYGLELDRDILYNSIAEALSADHDIDTHKSQSNFYAVLHNIKANRQNVLMQSAAEELAKQAKTRKMRKISDILYGIKTSCSTGRAIHAGDSIAVEMKFKGPDLEDLGMPSPETVTVGEDGGAPVMTLALSTMKEAESAVFATSAASLLGEEAGLIRLKPDDIVYMHITVGKILKSASGNETPEETISDKYFDGI